MSNRTFLKALMAYVAGGHLLTGLFCILGRRGIERVGAPLYGAHFEPDAQFSHIVRPAGAFVAGLAANNSLLTEVRRYVHVPYHSTLYTVSWKGGLHATVDGRIPQVEVATL